MMLTVFGYTALVVMLAALLGNILERRTEPIARLFQLILNGTIFVYIIVTVLERH